MIAAVSSPPSPGSLAGRRTATREAGEVVVRLLVDDPVGARADEWSLEAVEPLLDGGELGQVVAVVVGVGDHLPEGRDGLALDRPDVVGLQDVVVARLLIGLVVRLLEPAVLGGVDAAAEAVSLKLLVRLARDVALQVRREWADLRGCRGPGRRGGGGRGHDELRLADVAGEGPQLPLRVDLDLAREVLPGAGRVAEPGAGEAATAVGVGEPGVEADRGGELVPRGVGLLQVHVDPAPVVAIDRVVRIQLDRPGVVVVRQAVLPRLVVGPPAPVDRGHVVVQDPQHLVAAGDRAGVVLLLHQGADRLVALVEEGGELDEVDVIGPLVVGPAGRRRRGCRRPSRSGWRRPRACRSGCRGAGRSPRRTRSPGVGDRFSLGKL